LTPFKSPLSLLHIDTRRDAVEKESVVTVGVEELALSNSISIVALVELLEEKGLMKQEEVLKRVKLIKNRKEPS